MGYCRSKWYCGHHDEPFGPYITLYTDNVLVVSVILEGSQICFQWVLGSVLSETGCWSAAWGRRAYSLGISEVVLCLCGSDGFIRLWSSAHTGSVHSQVWSDQEESQHLQVWGHSSLQENRVLLPPGLEWVIALSQGVQVSQGLIHEWK